MNENMNENMNDNMNENVEYKKIGINKKYITVEEEEAYFLDVYDTIIGDVERAAFLTTNYLVEDDRDAGFMESIKSDMEKTFGIDNNIMAKMAAVDIAYGGILPLPEKGESVNVRMIMPPRKIGNTYIARCVIYGIEYDLQYDMPILSTMARCIFSEFEKAKLSIDIGLKCIVGRVFTIAGREWSEAPKELWKVDNITRRPIAPKVYCMVLRRDLESKCAQNDEMETDISNLPDFQEL